MCAYIRTCGTYATISGNKLARAQLAVSRFFFLVLESTCTHQLSDSRYSMKLHANVVCKRICAVSRLFCRLCPESERANFVAGVSTHLVPSAHQGVVNKRLFTTPWCTPMGSFDRLRDQTANCKRFRAHCAPT